MSTDEESDGDEGVEEVEGMIASRSRWNRSVAVTCSSDPKGSALDVFGFKGPASPTTRGEGME